MDKPEIMSELTVTILLLFIGFLFVVAVPEFIKDKTNNIETFAINNIKNIKDERRQRSDLKYSYTDIILGAFSMLYFQNPSWLSFQQKMQDNNGVNNAATMFDIDIPSQNHSKKLLDKLKPEVFKKIYDDILLECERLNLVNQFIFMKEYLLVAVDGVQYHSSQKVKCNCIFHNIRPPVSQKPSTLVSPKTSIRNYTIF